MNTKQPPAISPALWTRFSSVFLLAGAALLTLAAYQFAVSSSRSPDVCVTLASHEIAHRPSHDAAYASIENVHTGQQVLAYDPLSEAFTWQRVEHALRRTTDHLRILEITSATDNTVQEVRTTDEHPFWVPDYGWCAAGDLQVGDQTWFVDETLGVVTATRRQDHPEGLPVYNLTVGIVHTYFVAQDSHAHPLLVHNANACSEIMEAALKGEYAAIPKTYSRPSGFRKGVRDDVWQNAMGPDGKVIDPVTGREIMPDEPWDMGHKPGYEFWKHQQSAMARGIPRKQFLDEYNKTGHYRPELPSSNRGHSGEADDLSYFGD